MTQGHGATGQSGVSCAKEMAGSFNYGEYESGWNRMYVMDASDLGTEKAYDMSAIVKKNYPNEVDGTGGEVNCTSVPLNAILGYIEYTPKTKNEWSQPKFTATP